MKLFLYGGFAALLALGVSGSGFDKGSVWELKLQAATKNADMSEQCPRYKVSYKPALVPRYRCRFS